PSGDCTNSRSLVSAPPAAPCVSHKSSRPSRSTSTHDSPLTDVTSPLRRNGCPTGPNANVPSPLLSITSAPWSLVPSLENAVITSRCPSLSTSPNATTSAGRPFVALPSRVRTTPDDCVTSSNVPSPK